MFRRSVFALAALIILASVSLLAGGVSIEVWNIVVLLLFLSLLVLGAGATVLRGFHYLAVHEPMPKLLVRDMISRTGLAVPLTLLFGVRFLMPFISIQGLAQNPVWVLGTTVPAIVGVAVYAYYELFVLGGPDRDVRALIPTQLADIAQMLDTNTQVSRDAFQESNHANEKIAELKTQFDQLLERLVVEARQRGTVADAEKAIDAANEAKKRTSE